jgi:hypothetical protein
MCTKSQKRYTPAARACPSNEERPVEGNRRWTRAADSPAVTLDSGTFTFPDEAGFRL